MTVTKLPGQIRTEDAYAQGKMLDHSSWQDEPALTRGITPSDIDVVFDNNGRCIFCEISSQHSEWLMIAVGQRRLYESILAPSHCSVLCFHQVPWQTQINTRRDIIRFQILTSPPWGRVLVSPVYEGNNRWQNFVLNWINRTDGPTKLLSMIKKESSPLPRF